MPQPHQAPTPAPSCFRDHTLWGRGALPRMEGDGAYLKWIGPTWTQAYTIRLTLSIHHQQLGTWCHLLSRVVIATDHRRSLSSHLALALFPLSSILRLTKVTAGSTPWDRMRPMIMSDLALPQKPLGTHRQYRDAGTQRHSLKARIVKSFT